MTISSKPSDGEVIAEIKEGALGEKLIVGNKALITFFDDLVNNLGDDEEAQDGALISIISNIRNSIDESKVEITQKTANLFSLLSIAMQNIEQSEQNLTSKVGELTAKINNMPSPSFFEDLAQRVNNLEQVAWQ